ncbi:hypothetical protein TBR22_A07630 [Luteitalea sp. TBR-22]|uniref:GNAT family N-acetyltransferase n=1 Tax=Luteitalea sp. TBR-22 TaxID=2802971 RepID=UPI001AF8D113|nr:GNAT family N-acetyltransferase [Luteitalea sp. TBR-22]BCS31561.1 hypothetical protein TBR22_A07630 [Luteitalea sp. TBR-22]
MTSSAFLRPATTDDAAAIADVCGRAARQAYAPLVSPDYLERVLGHFYGVERLRRETTPTSTWSGFTVAQEDRRVVGVAGSGRSSGHEATWELFVLYVAPDAQRRGIGRQLLEHVVADAQRASALCLQAAVMPGNLQAMRFYESCGFAAAGTRPIYAPHGEQGGPPEALIYERMLAI